MTRSIAYTSLGGIPIQIDPMARDFEGFRSLAIRIIQQVCPEWTDFYPADPGVALIESVSAIADALSYAVDKMQNESYLLTAQERSAVVDITQLVRYNLSPPVAATATVLVDTTIDNVSLPVGFTVSTSNGTYQFELLQGVTLGVAHALTNTITVVEGDTVDNELLANSTGLKYQQYAVEQYPYASNPGGEPSLVVYVDGEEWDLSDNNSLLGAAATDKVYRYVLDAAGILTVLFGDGVNGSIPTLNAEISVDYRVASGAAANSVGIGQVNTIVTPISGTSSVSNPAQPSGGADAETIQHAKVQAPASVRANDRCVTLEDFVATAQDVDGVSQASAELLGGSPYSIGVYVMAEGANPVPTGTWYRQVKAGTGLLGVVGRTVVEKCLPPVRLIVEPVSVIRPYVEADIYCISSFLRSTVSANVNTALRSYYASAMVMGRGVPLSDFIGAVEAARGVDYVNVHSFRRIPTMRFVKGNPTAWGQATVQFTSFQAACEYDIYTVKWISSSLYRITGSVHGMLTTAAGGRRTFQSGVAEQIILYPRSTDPTVPAQKNQLTLTITLGATPPSQGDEWSFGVDSYLGNMAASSYEAIVPTVEASGRLSAAEFNLSFGGGLG